MQDVCPEILPDSFDPDDILEYHLRDIRDGCLNDIASTIDYISDPHLIQIWLITHIAISGTVSHSAWKCCCVFHIDHTGYHNSMVVDYNMVEANSTNINVKLFEFGFDTA